MKKWTSGIVRVCSEGGNEEKEKVSLLESLERNLTIVWYLSGSHSHIVKEELVSFEPKKRVSVT